MNTVFNENTSPNPPSEERFKSDVSVCANTLQPKKIRIRYKIPTYKKSDKINANIKSYQGNQRHIFRYRTLHAIYEKTAEAAIQGQLKIEFGELKIFYSGLVLHMNAQEPYLAEIEGTELLPVEERIRIHIRLLRLLRQGEKVRKAVKTVRAGRYGKVNAVDKDKS